MVTYLDDVSRLKMVLFAALARDAMVRDIEDDLDDAVVAEAAAASLSLDDVDNVHAWHGSQVDVGPPVMDHSACPLAVNGLGRCGSPWCTSYICTRLGHRMLEPSAVAVEAPCCDSELWSNEMISMLDTSLPAIMDTFCDVLRHGIDLVTDYSGLGGAEIAIDQVMSGLAWNGKGDLHIKCARASDVSRLCQECLLLHEGPSSPVCVLRGSLERSPYAFVADLNCHLRTNAYRYNTYMYKEIFQIYVYIYTYSTYIYVVEYIYIYIYIDPYNGFCVCNIII
jgi:hypothetical protein